MEDDATGHRYGNFPNYYSFHPPKNRLDVLRRSGILNCILDGLHKTPSSCDASGVPLNGLTTTSTHDGVTDAREATDKISRKKPRLDREMANQVLEESCVGNNHTSRVIRYCDLGCNEGNLTWAMAELLSGVQDSAVDDKVNPIKISSRCTVNCLGLDIDDKLIERANSKYCSAKTSEGAVDNKGHDVIANDFIPATFKTANLCNAIEHNDAVFSYIDSATQSLLGKSNDVVEGHEQTSKPNILQPRQVFDITTIFSTTMWIHVHAGDIGLKAFLERACGWTKKFILVEPQPSGW